MQSFPGGMIPMGAWFGSGGTSLSALTIDAVGEKAGIVFNVRKTGNIVGVRWRTGTVTTGSTVDVRLETVSSNLPSGTLWGTTTNGAHIVNSSDDDMYLDTPLILPATVTAGDFLAAMIVQSTGSLILIAAGSSYHPSSANTTPRGYLYTSSWSALTVLPVMLLEYDDGEVVSASGYRAGTLSSSVLSSASSPDERGNLFQCPVPSQIIGIQGHFRVTAAGTADIVLYDSANTVLATMTITPNELPSSAGVHTLYFSSPVNLDKATNYRLTFVPSSMTIHLCERNASDVSLPFFGADFVSTSRTDAGSWSEDATLIVDLHPIFSGFDDGAGGGGGMLTHPGMSGGMRG